MLDSKLIRVEKDKTGAIHISVLIDDDSLQIIKDHFKVKELTSDLLEKYAFECLVHLSIEGEGA